MTTANKVTIIRILLIPVFIALVLYYFNTGNEACRVASLVCFAVASILDGVDGYIARHYNQHSELGAILDPLADKLLLVSGIVLLSLHSPPELKITHLPLWVTITIISRDALLLIGMLLLQIVCGKTTVRPRIIGKVATVLQMSMVLWTLLKWSDHVLAWLAPAAGILTGISGLLYTWDGTRQLGTSPKSLPSPKN
ncbi:MAG TPA: CDP-alcohol phosphatidyltransferase family protein [Verrucomicrobiae bacterium]|nr:CDP-alcohol phosphatidyltransferase family protein [Verrucomicrobiae bacterium]